MFQFTLPVSSRQRSKRHSPVWLFLGLLLGFFIFGCGGSDVGRHPVFGAIQGAEGQVGMITFIPVGEPSRPSATGPIEDGQYEFDDTNGPCSGQHRVLIRLNQSQEAQPQEPQPKSDKVLDIDRRRMRVRIQPTGFVDKTVEVAVPDDGPWRLDIQLP